LVGFELQFGAFAVAQLRLLAEMLEIGADATPRLFVTDTLGDPFETFERAPGVYGAISRSRAEANEVKQSEPITVVIGNPPYKEKAKGKGAWIESGSGNKAAPYKDWLPPKSYGRGATANAKHLRNLYVYFWRWAAWKVFEQGIGGRDKQPPVEEKLSGIVCYITVAGFLNGPGFQKMRADLRRDCDDIWVIDCSPEGLLPPVPSRIFQGVKHPVCIVLALRTPANDPAKPARVRYRALGKAHRNEKFVELSTISLAGSEWSTCGKDWRDPFLPQHAGGWADFVAIEEILGDMGLGVMPGRVWPIAPDQVTLKKRWNTLISEQKVDARSKLFHPHLSGGPSLDRGAKALAGYHSQIQSINGALKDVNHADPKIASTATASFAEDLVRPGLRVPLTADAALFAEAAKLGREVIRLHTFGERFATEDPPRPPRVGEGGPTQPKDGAIPSTPEGFPDTLEYDAARRRLLVGTGFIDNVPPAVWAYEVSGKQVLRQWFSYRRKNRERPLIGDKRPPSPLGDIQPDRWLPEYTSELINVLNVLALLVELEPKQADLMKRVCDGPLIPASKLTA
ncbi:MAG: DNA methyltransferase, partial [Hyphomonas sp.]|uniref:type ISP restriction/modification enzyme n=1 Tax=Hyphomonas sp. TaxID=87 RepID=UPI001D8B0835